MALFLLGTNRWMGWAAGYRLLTVYDELDYRAIARAAPGLPAHRMSEQHAQRFPFHYVIGLIADAAGGRVELVYAVAVVLVALLLCVLLGRLVDRLTSSDPAFVLCMALFVLNTYSLRYYFIAPGEIADLIFEIGVVTAVTGLLDHRYALVLLGVAVATLARQTALPAVLAIGVWLVVDPNWARRSSLRRRALETAGVVVLAGGIYAGELYVAAPFSAHTTPGLAHFTMLAELEALPSGAGTLAQHLLRCVNGLFAVAAVLLVVIARLRRQKLRLPFTFWGCLLIALSIFLQPVVFSAAFASHNEDRLVAMALPPFVAAAAAAINTMESSGTAFSRRAAWAAVVILAVGSLHHLYTTVGTSSAAQTVVLQGLAAAVVGAFIWRKTGPHQHSVGMRVRGRP